MRWMEYLLLTDKNIRYDTKIYFRPFGLIYRTVVPLASTADSRNYGEAEDARRSCVFCAEACWS